MRKNPDTIWDQYNPVVVNGVNVSPNLMKKYLCYLYTGDIQLEGSEEVLDFSSFIQGIRSKQAASFKDSRIRSNNVLMRS